MDAKAKFGDVYVVNNRFSFAYSAKGDYIKALEYANKALLQAPSDHVKTIISGNIKNLKDRKDINQ